MPGKVVGRHETSARTCPLHSKDDVAQSKASFSALNDGAHFLLLPGCGGHDVSLPGGAG